MLMKAKKRLASSAALSGLWQQRQKIRCKPHVLFPAASVLME